jgi:RND family efflux transporter MFP subunit
MKHALSSRLTFWSACAALAHILLLSGCRTPTAAQANPVSAASVPVSSAPNPQPTASAGNGSDAFDSKTFTTTGPLVAEQQADLAAERDGRVVTVAAEIGDHVRSGQLLARLDDRALQSICDSQKAKVASLQAQIREWESEQKVEEADLRRADAMRAEKIRTEEDWEHVKYRLDETIAEVARYRADEAVAEADLKYADLQLEQSLIVAPFSGVVGRSSLRIAQEVKKGDVLFWITAEAPLRVLFTVPESAMAAFPTGAPLELTTAVYPQLRQQASVLRVSPVVDPASGSLQVIGTVVRPSMLLKPGMTMQVRRTP